MLDTSNPGTQLNHQQKVTPPSWLSASSPLSKDCGLFLGGSSCGPNTLPLRRSESTSLFHLVAHLQASWDPSLIATSVSACHSCFGKHNAIVWRKHPSLQGETYQFRCGYPLNFRINHLPSRAATNNENLIDAHAAIPTYYQTQSHGSHLQTNPSSKNHRVILSIPS